MTSLLVTGCLTYFALGKIMGLGISAVEERRNVAGIIHNRKTEGRREDENLNFCLFEKNIDSQP